MAWEEEWAAEHPLVKVPEEAWAAACEEAWAVAWEVPAEEWVAAWEEMPWWGMKHDRIGCRRQHQKRPKSSTPKNAIVKIAVSERGRPLNRRRLAGCSETRQPLAIERRVRVDSSTPAQPAGPTRWVGCEVREVEDGEVEDDSRRFEDGGDVGGGRRAMKIGGAGLDAAQRQGLLHR